MRIARSTLASAWLASLAVAGCSSPAPSPSPAPQAAPLAPSPASAARATLAGNLSPLATPAADAGRLDPATPLVGMSLLLRPSPAQKAGVAAALAALQDPASSRYRQWLTPTAYAARFGASATDGARATSWLSESGFTVHGLSPTATRVLFSGTAGLVEQAFQTSLHRYSVDGVTHFALARAPSVPADLAPLVLGLRGVHDFRMSPKVRDPRAGPRYLSDAGGATSGLTLTMGPDDFAAIYDLGPLYAAHLDGTGQAVALVGEGDIHDSDVLAFQQTFGLDTANTVIHDLVPYSGNEIYGHGGAGSEGLLDVEWSGAVARQAAVHFVYTGDSPTYDVFDALAYAIELGNIPVISTSWGGCEGQETPVEAIYLETLGDVASVEGVTVLSSSGDSGAADCDYKNPATRGLQIDWPGSIPSVVSVGGTQFDWGDPVPEVAITPAVARAQPFATYWTCNPGATSCAAAGYLPETGWNEVAWELAKYDYFWGASGGGQSLVYPKPYWQTGVTPPGTFRQVPDVSLSAAYFQVGYAAVEGRLLVDGGTSASAPAFAGILTLVNQALALDHPGAPVGLGNVNPALYAISASTTGTPGAAFHDVTTGDNDVPCEPGSRDCPSSAPYEMGYSAGPGFDMASGLGSVDANRLVQAFRSLAPTSVTLHVERPDAGEGAQVTLTAKVTSQAASPPMTGSVIFYASTYADGGAADLSQAASGALTATRVGGHEGGTTTVATTLPAGLLDVASVVAFYGGDAHYLASWSSASSRRVTTSFAVTPAALTLAPGGRAALDSSGGFPPIQWTVVRFKGEPCPSGACTGVKATSSTSAEVTAGSTLGEALVEGIDSQGAAARVTVLVKTDAGADAAADAAADSATDSASDSASGSDSATDSASDSASDSDSASAPDSASDSASTPDAASPLDADIDAAGAGSSSSSSCGCRTVGSGAPVSTNDALGAVGVAAAALALLRRRRSASTAR